MICKFKPAFEYKLSYKKLDKIKKVRVQSEGKRELLLIENVTLQMEIHLQLCVQSL